MKFHLNRKIILYYCNAFVLKKKVVNKSNNAWFNKIDINKFRKIAKTAKLWIERKTTQTKAKNTFDTL
jgi:Holliday junction resolvase-like predicted endonuclease